MDKPKNVATYISKFPEQTQVHLKQLRSVIISTAPDAEEIISYGMPAYKLHGILAYFAAYDNHIGFYATPSSNIEFAKKLSKYKTGKGSVQFPIGQPLPLKLISSMLKFKMNENLQKQKLKLEKKTKSKA